MKLLLEIEFDDVPLVLDALFEQSTRLHNRAVRMERSKRPVEAKQARQFSRCMGAYASALQRHYDHERQFATGVAPK